MVDHHHQDYYHGHPITIIMVIVNLSQFAKNITECGRRESGSTTRNPPLELVTTNDDTLSDGRIVTNLTVKDPCIEQSVRIDRDTSVYSQFTALIEAFRVSCKEENDINENKVS